MILIKLTLKSPKKINLENYPASTDLKYAQTVLKIILLGEPGGTYTKLKIIMVDRKT